LFARGKTRAWLPEKIPLLEKIFLIFLKNFDFCLEFVTFLSLVVCYTVDVQKQICMFAAVGIRVFLWFF